MRKEETTQLLIKVFGSMQKSRDGCDGAVSCPICDPNKEKKKLSINLDDFRFQCWVCGKKGKNVWKLAKKISKIQIPTSLFSNKKIEKNEELILPAISLPKKSCLITRGSNDPDVLSVKNYLLRRGLTSKDLLRWRIMATSSGKMSRKAIIPSFDKDGNLNYFVGRSIDNNQIRYTNSSVPKKDIIFNEIDIDWKKDITLVEGVFDAIKCPDNTIPILGSTLSIHSYLFQELLRNQSNVTVALDPDLKEKAYIIAKNLYSAGCNVKTCFAPTGKDMGDLTHKECEILLDNATVYSPYTMLSFKINSIKSGSIL